MESSKYTIENGIPIPSSRNTGKWEGGEPELFPLNELEVGQSFLVTGRSHNGVSTHISVAKRYLAPKRFTTREMTSGTRVWRIE